MANKGKSTKRKKAHQKQDSSAIKKTASKPVQNVEYEKLRDAIVAANKIIREEENLTKSKAMEEDHMTKLLVELLNVLFMFVMAILGIFSIASVIVVFRDSFASGVRADRIVCIACWLAFIAGTCTLLLLSRLRKQGKFLNRFWFSFISYITFALIIGAFLVAFFSSELLFMTMSVTVVFAILFSFCYLAMQSLKREKDRTYVVSYFSAITGIAALVVSAITLIATIPN